MERTHPVDDLETTRSTTRTKTDQFAFRLPDRDVLAQPRTGDAPTDHEHRVVSDDGIPVDCTCVAVAEHDQAAKHQVGDAARDAVLEAAVRMQVATDGGTASVDAEDQSEPVEASEQSTDCDCAGLPAGVPCWPCYRDGRATFAD